jgi:hypothetical protein
VSYLQTTYALHHYWGLRAIDLDADALAASRFVVRSLKDAGCSTAPQWNCPPMVCCPRWS